MGLCTYNQSLCTVFYVDVPAVQLDWVLDMQQVMGTSLSLQLYQVNQTQILLDLQTLKLGKYQESRVFTMGNMNSHVHTLTCTR